MSIKAIIAEPVKDRTDEVTHEGKTYNLRGRPDATIVTRAVVGNKGDLANYKAHYSKITGSDFGLEDVLGVRMVAACLEHEDDPSKRYDETEMAQLAVRESGLFLKLMHASSKILGFSADEKAILDGTAPNGLVEAAAGESEAGDSNPD